MIHLKQFETLTEFNEAKSELVSPWVTLITDSMKSYYSINETEPSIADYLCFTAFDGIGTITLDTYNEECGYISSLENELILYKSSDGINFESWDGSVITLLNGEKVYIYGENPNNWIKEGEDDNGDPYLYRPHFSMSGKIVVSGNIQSLISKSCPTEIPFKNYYLGMFYMCSSLIEIHGIQSIDAVEFYGCTSLTEITIPDSVTSIGDNAFYGCSGLTSVIIPDSVTSIGDGAFSRCTSLTGITIPDSVTSIGYGAFNGCSGLTSVIIPDSVTSIGDCAFSRCTSLTGITIPDSVTSISQYAFENCTSLTGITIPDSVTSIGILAFSNCSGLTSITYTGTIEQWNTITKGSNWKRSIPSTCRVHCTDGDVNI